MRLLRNAVALAVLAAAALAGPTLVPTAQADSPGVDPSRLTVAVGPHWVAPGGSATISATLLRDGIPYAGAPIDLVARVPASGEGFALAATTITSADGTVAFTVTPKVRTVYRLRFAGNDETRGSTSRRLVVRTAWQTRLAIATGQGPTTTTVVGELRGKGHRLRGRLVMLESYVDGDWVSVASQRSRRDGRVGFAIATAGAAGDYRLRFAGAGRYLASTSATVTLG